MKKTSRAGLSDGLLVGLSALFLVGIRTFLSPCGPKEDGSWMTCHWAGQAATGVAAVLLVLAVLHLLARQGRVKLGMDIAMMVVALYGAVIPNHVIALCMMPDMRCHQIMTPGVTVCGILVIAAAILDGEIQRRRGERA